MSASNTKTASAVCLVPFPAWLNKTFIGALSGQHRRRGDLIFILFDEVDPRLPTPIEQIRIISCSAYLDLKVIRTHSSRFFSSILVGYGCSIRLCHSLVAIRLICSGQYHRQELALTPIIMYTLPSYVMDATH